MRTKIENLLSQSRRIHMIGIGGIGMAGLAVLLKARGHIICGCDKRENRQTAWLREKGINVSFGHDLAHLAGVDWVIRSTAVSDDHPEVKNTVIPVNRRGEVLAVLLRDRFTIAVSGTHGKTTTTAMLAQILGCGYCIGGEVDGFDGVAADDEMMVVEADESDGTVAFYHPDIAVITNIEYDHMEHHATPEAFMDCFKRFIANTKKAIIYCADDPNATRLCKNHPAARPYGFSITDLPFRLPLPGRHNRLNALAAIEVSRQWKTRDEIFRCLEKTNLIKRRFETVITGDYTVISDYAHHPTEIRALIQTAHETLNPKRLLAIFQPHRYTRTRALLNDFPSVFQGVEKLWLLPVYAASEKPLSGGSSIDLFHAFPRSWEHRILFFQSMGEAWKDIQTHLCTGDVLLIVGAGDIGKLAEQIASVDHTNCPI